MSIRIILLTVLLCVMPSCWQSAADCACIVSAYFMTARDQQMNVDSVAVWHGPEGQHWLIATAKSADTLPVYDAVTGQLIKTIGSPGTGLNQLKRPNGIAIADDLLFIVERDNARLQIFQLPEGNAIAATTEKLELPYGIAVITQVPNQEYIIYVTENGGPKGGVEPKKVNQYLFAVAESDKNPAVALAKEDNPNGQHATLTLLKTFGDTQGKGTLLKVESIAADPAHNRLFVADEHTLRKNVKIYTLDGKFTGKTIGDGLILYEPEGIALYELNNTDGYVVLTDQDRQENTFWIYDRKTLKPLRSFIGENTRNTDGIAITTQPFGPFMAGALYAVHDDGNIHAYDWHTLATACKLEEKRL